MGLLEDLALEFENKFRGPRELILERLKIYEPILKFIATSDRKPLALDLGCGRGEFLDLCTQYGIEALGVDINEKNVNLVKSLGFKVYKDDILNFLRKQDSDLYNLVSLIHVIEHLEFSYILDLLKEVHRVLKNGGIFIIETPYVKSPLVAFNFWIDPTHKRPIHPDLISFIGKVVGFSVIEVFPLTGKRGKDAVSFMDLFYSSPDVSVILVKNTDDKYYMQNIRNVLSELRSHASLDLEEVCARLTQEYNSWAEEVRGLGAALAQLTQRFDATNKEISDIKSRLDALWNSKPWRAYQFVGKTILKISNSKNKVKHIAIHTLKNIYEKLSRHPRLYTRIKRVLDRYPNIKNKLVNFITIESKTKGEVQSEGDAGRRRDFDITTIYSTNIFLKRIRRWK